MPKLVEASWEEFRQAGLLWWINRGLHLFGWAIVVEIDDESRDVRRVYPARCPARGFYEADETEGFVLLTKHLEREMPRLVREVES